MSAHAACLWLTLEDDKRRWRNVHTNRWSHAEALAKELASQSIAWGHCQSHFPF